jgi:hypothetical protein
MELAELLSGARHPNGTLRLPCILHRVGICSRYNRRANSLSGPTRIARGRFQLRIREEPMRYKPRSIAALQTLLEGVPDRTPVQVDADTGVAARTVGQLRKVAAWPDNLAITTPQQNLPGSTIKISKASHATRTSPKS